MTSGVRRGELHHALAERPCFGSFLKLPRPEVVDVLAIAGFDFVIVDMEHGQISELEARLVLLACSVVDLPAVVRLPDPSPGVVNRLLEAGAEGIQMPRARTAHSAARLRSMMKFPPEGTRSVGVANRWAGYGDTPLASVVMQANERGLVVGMLETRDHDEPLDEVIRPLDVVFVGVADLSLDFGLPENHPTVQDHVTVLESCARGSGKVLGFPARTAEEAIQMAARGYRYIALGNDVGMLGWAAKSMVSRVKGAAQA